MSIEYFLMKQFLQGSQTDNGRIILVASSPACAQRQFAKATNTLRRFSDYLDSLDLPRKQTKHESVVENV